MEQLNAYRILRDLLRDTAAHTGEAFLRAAVQSFADRFRADFAFITESLEAPVDTVRMLAASRDGKEIEGWQFALSGTPCELIYRDQTDTAWEKTRVGNKVAIAEDVCRRFSSTQDTTYQAFFGVPLWNGENRLIGHVALFFERPLRDHKEREFILELVELFSYKVQSELNRLLLEQAREKMLQDLQEANRRLAQESITDALTGLYNRRHFNQRMQQAFTRHKRSGEQFALMLLDLDDFKHINDAYGHDVGDTVLCKVAQNFLKATRADVEMAFRIGGEEFAILCHGSIDTDALTGLGERINRAVRSMKITSGKIEIPVTVSIGAALPKAKDTSWDMLYVRADGALYKAKQAGRDSTVVAQ